MTLVWRGPLPACATAAATDVRGRRGANTLRLTGSVRGRRLAPGRYLVELRSGSTPSRWRLVDVVARGARPVRASAGPVVDHCTAVAAELRLTQLADAAPASLAVASTGAAVAPRKRATGTDAAPHATASPPPPPGFEDFPQPRADVLGVEQIEEAVETLPPALGIVLILALLGSLAATVWYVVYFLRRS